MQLTKINHKNYTTFQEGYQLVLPLNIEGLIPEDDSVRLLSHVLGELNYHKLYSAYSSLGRKPAIEPITMFKILVYAYSQNIYSSRAIEKACRRDINFWWLLAGQKAPDHSSISRFRNKYAAEAIEDLFYQLVNYLFSINEIQFINAFIDGTKIEANANRYTFVWKKAIIKNEAKRHINIQATIADVNTEFIQTFKFDSNHAAQCLKVVLTFREKKRKENHIEFVHGSGKRPTKLQKYYETLETYYARQLAYDEKKELFQGRNSYSKTDHDATFMHMKEDHMKNGQLKPGYNVQIAVESEFVTGVDVFSDRNDLGTLIPLLKSMEEEKF